MQLYFNGCFVFKVSDCDIDEMFTYADADCDGRIRYRPDSLIKYFPSHSFYLPSWSEFQTMIVPQPVGGVGVAGGGSWARAVPRHAPGPEDAKANRAKCIAMCDLGLVSGSSSRRRSHL